MDILRTLELFTPRVLVNDTHLTHRANNVAKERTIAQMIVAVFLISLIAIAGQCYLYYQIAPTEKLKATVLALYGFAYLYVFFALFSFKFLHCSTSVLSNSYAGWTLMLTLGFHTLTGLTMQSPAVPLYFFIPAWAFLSCSSRSGLWWSAIVAGVFCTVTLITPLQLDIPNIIPTDSLASFRLASSLLALILIATCLYAHLNSFLALAEELDEDRLLYAHKARHDPLTGLANREQFDMRLQNALDDAIRHHQHVALVYIDLNDFKAVNDTHGHQVGDKVLQTVSRRINNVVRDSDTTARLGGDEFGVVLPNLKAAHAAAHIVRKIEDTLLKPMTIDDISIAISGSVGLAITPNDGSSASSLTRSADRNMYDAKRVKTQLELVQAV